MGFAALILEPDVACRSRVKELTEAHGSFDKCVASATLAEAGDRLRQGGMFDAIYISTRFDAVVVSHFIASVRREPAAESAASLMMVTRDSTNISMKQFELGKPDGYLLEPLVARDLDGSVAFVVKHKQSLLLQKEVEAAPVAPHVNIKALCARMAIAIDRGKPGLKDLQELSKKVELLSDEQKLQYYEELVKYLSDFKAPEKA
jgi:DNA-binding response OmpR family regulator